MTSTAEELREEVRRRYAESARAVTEQTEGCGCGSGSCCAGSDIDAAGFGEALYDAEQRGELPDAAVLASLGCGNPVAIADLHEGERVLDLGSGGGIDVILSAKRVGPAGTAYGLDMTDEMLALAQRNAAEAGVSNVHFLKGHIEQIPLPAGSVDVIISNCVINLSGDKRQVLAEAFRVLRPGGRFAVSDVIVRDGLPEPVKASMAMWSGCVGGALEEQEFLALLRDVGFESPSIEPTRVYTRDDALALLADTGLDDALADEMAGRILSAFVRATKPGTPAARAAKPARQLAVAAPAPETSTSTRACGCADTCCT